jgi:glycerol-3-phosphate dehydrogenase
VWEERGLLSVAGGKLTTWRTMAVEVVDRAVRLLPGSRAVPPSATAGTSVGALAPADLAQRLVAVHGLEPAVADALARRLGGVAWAACAEAKGPAELRPLADGFDLTLAEARAHLRYGAVLRLEDLLVRRARAALWAPEVAHELVPRLETLFRDEMGWGSGRWEREAEAAGRAIENWSPPG